MNHWQETMLDKLIAHLEPSKHVLGLLLFGSCARSHYDRWSDIDLLVVVKDFALDNFFPTVAWLDVFGKAYTFSQSADEFKCVTRVCYENFERIDFVFTTEERLSHVDDWPSVPFFGERKILFSRSGVLKEIAGRAEFAQKFTPATEDRFLELVRNFRFKSVQAVYKVLRGDLLIAVHLAQDLVRDCCVLGMLLRDRATGTNIHKQGGMGNALAAHLEQTQKPFTPLGILDSIQASNEIFETLSSEWSSEYQVNHLIGNWIEKARVEVHDEDADSR